LTSRRRFPVARRCAERCQLKQAAFEDIRAMIRRSRAGLVADIKALDARIAALIAAQVGPAPFARESGRWRGKRVCRGGRKDL